MTPAQIVEFLRSETDDCLRKYADFFVGQAPGQCPAENLAARTFLSLSEDERRLFLRFLRSVQTDTLGCVFGLLDNQAYPGMQSEDLQLTHGDEELNGDLTDILFEKEEAEDE